MNGDTARAESVLRAALAELPVGAAWPAGKAPTPDEIFTPPRQKNVLDVTRSLVIGNRGVGKTFWSHALSSVEGRKVAADAYDLPQLRNVDAVFGFRGTVSDQLAPSPQVIEAALKSANDPLVIWQSILLRALGPHSVEGIPSDLVELAKWFSANPEAGDRRIRAADEDRRQSRRPLVVLFDALDTLANDWAQIRSRTEGLLRLAVLAKGLRATHIKIFMRPDQFADAQLFRFPDASKLRAERVELQWGFSDLYSLMVFHLLRMPTSRDALERIARVEPNLLPGISSEFALASFQTEQVQRPLFVRIAGQWMGSDKRRGSTFSWLIQHLADARGETTPRGFLTALRAAAQHEPAPQETAIDYRGIRFGVAEASENRVDDLLQDYWWIDYVKEPLADLETPLDRDRLLQAWQDAGVATAIKEAARERGLLPVFLALRPNVETLPREIASRLDTDEAALLETMQLIGVMEIRSNGKVNVPDIFRVAFKMKRRGGVPPKRATHA